VRILRRFAGNRRRRRGGAALEFALVFPVFFSFFLGLIEVARGVMVIHQLNNAARVGCRTGVIEGKASSDITTAVTNNLSGQGFSGESIAVLVNGATADASTAQAGDEITVKVSVAASGVTWVSGGLQGTLVGQCSLRRE
jgi:Flp pilus assembly protein TadG